MNRVVNQQQILSGIPSPANVKMGEFFRFDKHGCVAELVLNRAKSMNTMNDGFFSELALFMQIINDSSEYRVVLIWAEGKHFSAGLDLKDASDIFTPPSSSANDATLITTMPMPAMSNLKTFRLIQRWQAAISTLQECRLPVIIALHGKCIGGAVDLLTAADMRVCTRDAEFIVKETDIAIVADIGTLQRLGRTVGRGVAREMVFTAKPLNAERALQTGLVNHVYANKAEMLEAARCMADGIAFLSPLAVQGAKRVMNYSEEHTIADGLTHVALWNSAFVKSDDLLKAGTAFFTKETPTFTDYLLP